MSNRKKYLALGLSSVMIAGCLAGCGKEEDKKRAPVQSESGKKEEVSLEGEELTIWAPIYWVGQTMSYEENEAWQKVQENLGIKLNFIHPASGEDIQQFNIMVASGDLPDIICTGWTGDEMYVGGGDKYIENGTLIRLNELIDEYAPDYKKAIENVVVPEEQKEFYTDNGNIYQFYAISPYEEWVYNGPLIRKDWLEELNIETPETIQEYEDMLVAFKEKKGAKSPLSLPKTGIDPFSGIFMSAWDIGPAFYQEDGQVKYGPIQSQFKNYLERMKRWYDMGLIDKDFPTRDDDALKRMLTTGETGMIISSPDTVGAWMEGVSEMVVGKYPVQNKGDKIHYRMKTYQARTPFGYAVTTSCKNPEAAVKFLNYGYTEEGYMLYNYGIEGETYNRTGETVTYNGIEYPRIEYTDKMMNNPDYPVLDAILKYKTHIGPFIRFEHEGNPALNQNNADIRQKLTEGADTTLNLPMITLNAEEGQEYARIMNQINTYQQTAVLQFIMGTRDLGEFDTYLEEMKQLEIEQAAAYEQAAYERYQARK